MLLGLWGYDFSVIIFVFNWLRKKLNFGEIYFRDLL